MRNLTTSVKLDLSMLYVHLRTYFSHAVEEKLVAVHTRILVLVAIEGFVKCLFPFFP